MPPNAQLLTHAIALHKSGNLAEAEAIYRQILASNPNDADALQLLGAVAHQREQYGASIELIRRSLAILPTGMQSWNNLGESLRATGQIDEALAAFRHVLELYPNYVKAHSNLLLTLHYDPHVDPIELRREHEQWAARHAGGITPPALTPNRDPDRPLRIGFISPDLRRHSVGYFIEPYIEQHDAESYPLFCYYNHARSDEVTARMRARSQGFRDIVAMNDDAVAQQIRDDGIDILIDLAGHMAGNRLLVLARKPAPVQATYLGYPNGTGLRQVDWRISDDETDLLRIRDEHYVERVHPLAGGCAWCYRPPEDSPEPVEPPSDRPITFGSFNNFAKISPIMARAWGQILDAVPGSRLVMKAKSLADDYTRGFALKMIEAAGIAPERVTLLGWKSGVREHLATYNDIDVALDTFPYNGTTTTCEALWMGVPVVTLSGGDKHPMHLSRVGASLLKAAMFKEGIAESPAEYIERAVKLANIRPNRRERRGLVRCFPLMDAHAFASSFEAGLRKMWRTYLGGG